MASPKTNNEGGFFSRHSSLIGTGTLAAVIFLIILLNSLLEKDVPIPPSPPPYSPLVIKGDTIPPLNFCGEAVPMTDTLVRRRITEEFLHIVFDQSPYLILNKKANRWFPVIEPILKKNGIPDDFKYIVVIESGLINSPSQPKAGGFWQLMPPVAQHYGLEVNEHLDERFNIIKATDAACKCILDAYEYYQNWTLAAASYDLGIGGLDKQIGEQNSKNYYELQMNEETASYIYRLLAFKELISNPAHYGYEIRKNSLYSPIPTFSVKVDSSITDLKHFAALNGSDLNTLKWMNPWILDTILVNPDHNQYELLFPKKGFKIYGMNENYSDKEDSVIIDSVIIFRDTIRSKEPE